MGSSIEYAFTDNGYMVIHFNGVVKPVLSRVSGKDFAIAKFKALAGEQPFPLDELAEVATALLKYNKKNWDVSDYAMNIAGKQKAKHPVTNNEDSITNIIMDLNDTKGWTREQIADWLDALPEQPVFKMDVSIITAEDLK